MAMLTAIARPYARAAFDYAKTKRALPAWQTFLEAASTLAKDEAIRQLLSHPELTKAQAQSVFTDLLAAYLDQPKRHFLALLAEHKRFLVLPDIAALFAAHVALLKKISHVRVLTAIEPNAMLREKITSALTQRLQQTVIVDFAIDPALLGGAVIHMGDKVIDGSIRGKLSRLLERLTA